MAEVKDATLDKLRLLQLENESLSVSILPEVGAKILTLFDKKTGRNILWENTRVRPQAYPIDANFDNYWCGGWDDAYPSADACIYKGEPIPNVGELRSLGWNVEELTADSKSAMARLSAYGPISPVKATKTVSLFGDQLQMQFDLESVGPIPIDYLWGAHPAFAVQEGTRLLLPAKTGIVAQSSHPSLGKARRPLRVAAHQRRRHECCSECLPRDQLRSLCHGPGRWLVRRGNQRERHSL